MAFIVMEAYMKPLKVVVRKSDDSDDWLLVLRRSGGDRFAIFMTEQELRDIAERIQKALSEKGVA